MLIQNPNSDPVTEALNQFLLTEKPSLIASPTTPAPANGVSKSKTELILDSAGLSKQRIASGIAEVVDNASNDSVKLRALEIGAKMHGMLDDNKQGITIQILNASGANLSSMLGAEIQK